MRPRLLKEAPKTPPRLLRRIPRFQDAPRHSKNVMSQACSLMKLFTHIAISKTPPGLSQNNPRRVPNASGESIFFPVQQNRRPLMRSSQIQEESITAPGRFPAAMEWSAFLVLDRLLSMLARHLQDARQNLRGFNWNTTTRTRLVSFQFRN